MNVLELMACKPVPEAFLGERTRLHVITFDVAECSGPAARFGPKVCMQVSVVGKGELLYPLGLVFCLN